MWGGGVSPRGEILGPGLRFILGIWMSGARVGQKTFEDKMPGF